MAKEIIVCGKEKEPAEEQKIRPKVCPVCGGTRFCAHQVAYRDVIVNEDGLFLKDAGIYESSDPYGPYQCVVCGREFESLDELNNNI